MGRIRIKMSLFMILTLLYSAAVNSEETVSITVREGDEVTLPCRNEIKIQQNCNKTSWLFRRGNWTSAEELVRDGRIQTNTTTADKIKRLRVPEDCSLVIKQVTRGDVGHYTCRSEEHDACLDLSLIHMESYDPDTFLCSVDTYVGCWHSVTWQYKGHRNDTETSQHTCSARLAFITPPLYQKLDLDEFLFCDVADQRSGQTLLCGVGSNSWCEKTESEGNASAGRNQTNPALLRSIIVSVGLSVLIITVVVVYMWMRTKGNQTQMDNSAVQNDDVEEDSVIYENSGDHDASTEL